MVKRLFVLYGAFLKSMRNHKIDTCLNLANVLVNQIVSMTSLYIICSNLPMFEGWKQNELVLMYGFFILNKGVANLFTNSLYSIERHIRDGSFDAILIRPISPLIQILGEQLEIGELVNMVIGTTVIVMSLISVDILNVISVIVIVVIYMVISVVLVFSIRLSSMSIAFWTLTSFPVAIAIDNLSDYAKYPIEIKNLEFCS